MNFFDTLITKTKDALGGFNSASFPYQKEKSWQDVGCNCLVLQRDTAFELDGIGYNLVTSDDIGNDEITVIGNDLPDIKKQCPFARICFISIDDVDDEQKAYNLIRKIEYVKYHYFPDGYMIRTSSRSHKEVVRVSKNAIKKGITFEKLGSLLISKFKENPSVKAVKVFFVTDENVDYKALESIAHKNNEITETLNHIMNSVNFDCNACNLKPICDEVEGMRELHFKSSMK